MFECHFHPADEPLAADLPGVLNRARDVGVTGFLATGYDPTTNQAVLAMASDHDDVVAAVGYHPWFLDRADSLSQLEGLAGAPSVVALGNWGEWSPTVTDGTSASTSYVDAPLVDQTPTVSLASM